MGFTALYPSYGLLTGDHMQPVPHVIGHIEKFCGPIVQGWSCDADGNEMPFQVAQMQGGPIAGTTTYSTLGLSKIPLLARNSDRVIRHELVMLSRSNAIPKNMPSLLQEVAMEAVQRNVAYVRGEVIGPRRSLFRGSTVTALYVAIPVYFPQDFSTVEYDVGRAIFAWLVPITGQEVSLINEIGWDEFETRLAGQDPDLLDFGRPSIVP
jgi:Suppressor of fused protein (SUFU)